MTSEKAMRERAERAEASRDEWKRRAFEAEQRAEKAEQIADRLGTQRDRWIRRAEKAERKAQSVDEEAEKLVEDFAELKQRAERVERQRDAYIAKATSYYHQLRELRCDHGYRRTDSCPGCDADEDTRLCVCSVCRPNCDTNEESNQ